MRSLVWSSFAESGDPGQNQGIQVRVRGIQVRVRGSRSESGDSGQNQGIQNRGIQVRTRWSRSESGDPGKNQGIQVTDSLFCSSRYNFDLLNSSRQIRTVMWVPIVEKVSFKCISFCFTNHVFGLLIFDLVPNRRDMRIPTLKVLSIKNRHTPLFLLCQN